MNALTKAEEKVQEQAEPVRIDHDRAGEAAPREVAPPQPVKRYGGSGRIALMLLVPLLLIAAGFYWWVTGGRYQSTDDAYLQQPKVPVSSEISGRVVESRIADTMQVKAGEILFRVDPAPYRIALEQANANLASARLHVEQLRAAYSQALAEERSARSEVEYTRTQLQRQQDLFRKGVAPRSGLDQAERNMQKAQESLSAARQAVASARAALGGDPDIATDQHPSVLAALAARDKAAYELQQTTVRAPADGVIYGAPNFRAGQYVSAGTKLFTLVETEDPWVEANFKETQLTHIRPGQSAEIVFDTFPDHPVHATVASIGAGTGAEFSLLPPQNATGNWVKVTQRIPVQLRLDPQDTALPLRTGMSATVTVDTHVTRGLAGLFGGSASAAE